MRFASTLVPAVLTAQASTTSSPTEDTTETDSREPLSKEDLMSYDPQTFLMQNLEYFSSANVLINCFLLPDLPVI